MGGNGDRKIRRDQTATLIRNHAERRAGELNGEKHTFRHTDGRRDEKRAGNPIALKYQERGRLMNE
jgi:hypothetical protein